MRARQKVKAKTRADMKATTLWMPAALHRRLLLASVELNWSGNEIMRVALREWLTRRERRKRSASH